jgi:hypothetical protein
LSDRRHTGKGIKRMEAAAVAELVGHPPKALMRELKW